MESGTYHFHFRQYDAKVGVWTTPDPIGILGGLNVYSYVENNPVNLIDVLGLTKSAGEMGTGNPGSYGGENTQESMYGGNGLGTGNDWGSDSGGLLGTMVDVLGKLWNLPNTIIGLAYGTLGHIIGEVGNILGLWDFEPEVTLGYNAIQFLNNPLTQTATVFGNVTLYRGGYYTPERRTINGNRLGEEEMQHTIQGQILGPLYFAAHVAYGLTGMITSGNFNNAGWHSEANILEQAPHSNNPSPWGCE